MFKFFGKQAAKSIPAAEPCRSDPADRRAFLRTATAAMAGAAAGTLWQPRGLAQTGQQMSARLQFQLIRRHENEHVAFLLQVLGNNARPKPTFQNLAAPNLTAFLNLSASLESIGTGAYAGAAPYVMSQTVLAGAAAIAATEARHTGFLNTFLGVPMTQNVFGEERSFERALFPDEIRALGAGFIASLNGGPPISFAGTPSAANDTAILNYALLLEFLEQDFYNINVPVYYP